MVSLKYLFWRPTNTLKTWFRENIRFGELSSTCIFCVKKSHRSDKIEIPESGQPPCSHFVTLEIVAMLAH